MKARDIKKVLSLGSGTIAQYTVTQCALFGHEVVIHAFSQAGAERARTGIKERILPRIIEAGMTTEAHAQASIGRMSIIFSKEEIPQDIDIVSEAVLEDLELKKKVWAEFAPYLPKHAILTTNSSTLLPSAFAEATGAPERFLAWHFSADSFFKNLVDVMPHPGTDPQYTKAVAAFSRTLNLNPVVLEKEVGGYLANSMLVPMMAAAVRLYSDGYATVDDIDRSWMAMNGVPLGPFAIMDYVGLNTAALVLEGHIEKERLAPLHAMIEAGNLGAKTGKGFYTYPNPAFKQPDFLTMPAPVGMDE